MKKNGLNIADVAKNVRCFQKMVYCNSKYKTTLISKYINTFREGQIGIISKWNAYSTTREIKI